MQDAAILVWLPKGRSPAVEQFLLIDLEEPPSPNPEPWWELRDAIRHAVEVQRTHTKLPWIKIGNRILSPNEIASAYEFMRRQLP